MSEYILQALNLIRNHSTDGWFCLLILALVSAYAWIAHLRIKVLRDRLDLAKEKNDLEADRFRELVQSERRNRDLLIARTSRHPIQGTKRILIVDDEKAIRELIGELIASEIENCSFAFAHDGEEALNYLHSETFSLLILDLVMPGKSGYEVLSEVARELPNLPIMVVSGYYASRVHVARTAGVSRNRFEILPKPFEITEIIALVRRLTSKQQRD